MIKKMNEMPKFFEDSGDYNDAEIILDFFLSWTLRCSIDKKHVNVENKKAQKYSKQILLFLLKDHLNKSQLRDISVISVETWKQWSNIDLVADVVLQIGEAEKKFVIVFENKLFTHVHDNQLNRYIHEINNAYDNKIDKVYIFLTADDEVSESDLQACKESKLFKALTFFELRNSFGDVQETGNSLFDEFWFRNLSFDKELDLRINNKLT